MSSPHITLSPYESRDLCQRSHETDAEPEGPCPQRPERAKPTRGLLLLSAILLLSLAVRLYRLDALSLWFDEGYTVKVTHMGLGETLAECARDGHVPLYYLILQRWVALSGRSEFALRLPSVVYPMPVCCHG